MSNILWRSCVSTIPVVGIGFGLSFGGLLLGCAHRTADAPAVVPAHPFADGALPVSGRDPAELPPPVQLSGFGSFWKGTAEASQIDSRAFQPQVITRPPWKGETKRPGEILPAHYRDKTLAQGAPNDLQSGGLTARPRIDLEESVLFPGIGQSPWTPPDPAIAVGRDFVLETVNMEIAWYEKDGTVVFQQTLDSSGDPGFFEELGAGGFTFDPKCFYDTIRERYVVLALEHYDGESWITIAVSDDDDPNGVWYKYRTWALVSIEDTTYWVDYPGFGFDAEGWYVTSNLFKEEGEGSGFGGTLVRSFDPTGALTGSDIAFVDFLLPNGSHQVAQVFDGDSRTVLVRKRNSTSLRLIHIEDPLGTPTSITRDVDVPEYTSPEIDPPTPEGASLNAIDGRILNVMIRNGSLWTGHSASVPDDFKTIARWYEIDMDGWPASEAGAPVLQQSGEIRPGDDIHTCYPAIAVNENGSMAVVYTRSSEEEVPSLRVAGRIASDPVGTLGVPVELALSTAVPEIEGTYRWGDYFDAAIDPTDENVFWVAGQIYTPNGWLTEIGSFSIALIGDLNGDGTVDGADLTILLGAWGTDSTVADLNGDGTVNGADITVLLGNWT